MTLKNYDPTTDPQPKMLFWSLDGEEGFYCRFGGEIHLASYPQHLYIGKYSY